ncbi:MAG: SIMPL domain-containing protein [Flavobacteriaceae bacterium CG_4_8_14_3_um_filter_34_10]|nr:SIMPL domain-containing protein [Flavobacteriia bacterium]OIP51397.1 MAG: SIMPL domain-containing protein [Flavobacteriaceae bacterium CG2_30_34_30]PIQ18005.1 MAG: SIMPL domain-containing protein [Flavobacteriaceae bacterium CG18_big_fil_WC_8_21_14_2_50_34_36]PIV51504.1 MAG: SIMPL domain-containing protein [Flavobacteriaceae bacterium CG02_land_8_20_14_3_00_34_13]PIX08504.1 MAG: SIMPL domain-containing protein [Flavobacteriaceae bacterium CG_4_8_14_3_um_filter_34_10]PIZ07353.1 MAG: SIMPL do
MNKIITVLFLLSSLQIMAQEKIQPLVTVMGEGIVKVVPDLVTINVSVESQGKKAQEVKNANDALVDTVLQFLKKSGITRKEVQTQYVRLNKSYDYNTKTYSYNASQSITILLLDITNYEKIISGLMESGINRIDGINFGSSSIDALKSEARIKAVADAKMKATEYANVLNQKVGKAIQISEIGQSNPMPLYKNGMMRTMDAESVEMETLAVGEMSIKAEINVSFELQ